MIELLGGVVIGGVAGVALKDKLLGANTQSDNKQQEIDQLCAENEKIRKRNKDMERQIEDLLTEINKVRKQAKSSDEDQDDLEDELDRVKREVKNLRTQNDELSRRIRDYIVACEAKDHEIITLKQKLG